MGIDWKGLTGPLDIPASDIKEHSLSHSPDGGFHFVNFPSEERYTERWRDLMIAGGALHECWKGLQEAAEGCYIMAPLGNSEFIYITSRWKKSGSRYATEMHSLVCEDSQSLVRELVVGLGGIREPPAWSIGLNNQGDVIEVSGPRGIGLSSWLFQLSAVRNATGVAYGVPIDLLNVLFPEVNKWIVEFPDNRTYEFSLDALKYLVLGTGGTNSEGRGGGNSEIIERRLNDYYSIEIISEVYDIDLGKLIIIFLDDEITDDLQTTFGLESREAIISRMILYDRAKPLSMLIDNPKLAKYWMENAKTKHAETDFPFTEHEMQEIISNQGPDACFEIFSTCLKMMSEYSSDSRVLMARYLTRVGGQEDIEKVWSSVGPIGKQGIESIMGDVKIWRNNDGIRDFWGLLGTLEGGQSDFSFRRVFASRIVSASTKPGDLEGLVRFIPDLGASEDNFGTDYQIISSISDHDIKEIARINQIQPSSEMIQRRLILFFRHKGAPKEYWKISDLIPESSYGLLQDPVWIRPILQEIKTRLMYDEQYPHDGFNWMEKLTPSEYLHWINDPIMSEFIKSREGAFEAKKLQGWIEPKAIAENRNLRSDSPDWEKKQEWARLLERSTISERMRYQKEGVSRLFSGVCLIFMIYCILITPPLVNHLGGNYLYGVSLAVASIALGWVIEKLRRSLKPLGKSTVTESIFSVGIIFACLLLSFATVPEMGLSFDNQIEMTEIVLGPISIPAPNSPFFGFLLFPLLYQINRIIKESRIRVSEMKQQSNEIMGIDV